VQEADEKQMGRYSTRQQLLTDYQLKPPAQ